MDYFTLQQTLSSLVDIGLLEEKNDSTSEDSSTTWFYLTDAGQTSLQNFVERIAPHVRQAVDRYVSTNRRKLEKDDAVSATYFPHAETENFMVKCGVYDYGHLLLEMVVSVDTRDQAKMIVANWRANGGGLYHKIIEALSTTPTANNETIPEP